MTEDEHICTICEGPFNMKTEGGILGTIGILPVGFCPTCLAGIMDMATQLINGEIDDDYDT
jgi:hypothetical protein